MKKIMSTNPATGEMLGEVLMSSEAEIVKKVQQAQKAKKAWKDLGVAGRVAILRTVVQKLKEKKESLAQLATKEMGMPIAHSRGDAQDAADYFSWYLDHAEQLLSPEIIHEDSESVHHVLHEPYGVAAVITPWNFPSSNFVWGAAQHLIAGNVVVYKTSEEVPLFGKLLEEIILSSGLPDGVFSEVYGDGAVGKLLVQQDINIIHFTGSTAVGKKLYQAAAEKFIKIICELGGSAPGIVCADANVDAAIEAIYSNRFHNSGQMCDALKRLIVHHSRMDEVVEKLKLRLKEVRMGDPLDERTDLGPLVTYRQMELVEAQVADAIEKGAKIVVGGKRPSGLSGAYYQPTIVTGMQKEMRLWTEEVFGPVLPVVAFETEDQAIRMANHTAYGLGGYIFTADEEKAIHLAGQIDSGMVSINGANYVSPASPFGGYKASGMGREHGKFGFADVAQVKVVAVPKG